MRFIRFVAKTLLVILFLFDVDMIYHFCTHSRRSTLIMKQVSPDAISVSVRRIPYTIWDWVELLILIAIHAILIYFLLWSRKKPKTLSGAQVPIT
jgi:hypothetical protein